MTERGEGARLVQEARQPPLERLEGRFRFRPNRLVFAPLREIAGEVLLDRDLELEVRIGREIGQAEAADPQSLLDLVFEQRIAFGIGRRR